MSRNALACGAWGAEDALPDASEIMENNRLIKSKERVQKHGEVFTPPWMVEKMLAHEPIAAKVADIHATILEPSAGEGAFLVAILEKRLALLEHNRSPFGRGRNWQQDALFAVATIYGIEYLDDNVALARERMRRIFCAHYAKKFDRPLTPESDLARSLSLLLHLNIVQGDTLKRKNAAGDWIVLNEWRQSRRPKSEVLRVPFYFDELFDKSEASEGLDLFADMMAEKAPLKAYKRCRIHEIWKEELRA